MLSPHEELDRLHAQSSRLMSKLLSDIQVAELRSDFEQSRKLTKQLGEVLSDIMASSDLLGRRRILLELRGSPILFRANIPFVEAAKSILSRYPALSSGWEQTSQIWRRRGFALALSTSKQITKKIQNTFFRSLREGKSQEETSEEILFSLRKSNSSITKAYSDLVFRNVISSAYTEGRREQMKRDGIRKSACGWRYVATHDNDTRENHLAGDNLIAHIDDKLWNTHSPPNGNNCRCSLEIVSTEEMVDLGLANESGYMLRSVINPLSFVPDPGFTSRSLV